MGNKALRTNVRRKKKEKKEKKKKCCSVMVEIAQEAYSFIVQSFFPALDPFMVYKMEVRSGTHRREIWQSQ